MTAGRDGDYPGDPVGLAPAETVADRLQRLERQLAALQEQTASRTPPGPSPDGFVARAGASLTAAAAGLLPHFAANSGRSFWAKFGFLRELQLVVRMYFDPRYRVSRFGQLAVPGLFALMVLNYFLFNWLMISIYLFTPVLERLVLVGLAATLYKVLCREAGRYAEVLSYLTRNGR